MSLFNLFKIQKGNAKYMVEQIINVRENDNTGYGS